MTIEAWFEHGAAALERLLARKRPLVVGVFEDQDVEEVNEIADETGIDLVQLSGSEPWSDCLLVNRQAIKVLRPRPGMTADDILAQIEPGAAIAFMLDPSRGTGTTGDWDAAAPSPRAMPLWLAGGLTPENVARGDPRRATRGPSTYRPASRRTARRMRRRSRRSSRAREGGAACMTTTTLPDALGHFGPYGGRYVPETLMVALNELTVAFTEALRRRDVPRRARPTCSATTSAGRRALYFAENLTRKLGGAKIYLKREDLAHTGAHKINNAIGRGCSRSAWARRKIIAETGAGQHGVATATVCAMLGLECVVYMGAEDVRRQSLNVFRMKLLGAKVEVVESGSRTLKDAMNEAIRDWVTNVRDTYYLIGSVVGPHPYPMTGARLPVRHRPRGARADPGSRRAACPTTPIACVGGGSNAIGLFHPFVEDAAVKFIGVEAAGEGSTPAATPRRCRRAGRACCTARSRTCCRTSSGQVQETHSISRRARLPRRRAGAQLLQGQRPRRRTSPSPTRRRSQGFQLLSETEGIIPALESSHAIAYVAKLAPTLPKDKVILLGLSGRGDKDINTVIAALGIEP